MMRRFLFLLVLAGCSNSLVDGVPRLYACARAEGLNSCPGGWRCGLSGFCQDPTQALPYSCESSDDCSAAWHCGAERLCYDRAAAIDRSCRASGDDCAPGWRCGREVRGQVCHPLGAGAAYLCANDLDCEGSWRCGPEGACVDVAAQGLRAGAVAFVASQVSPLLIPAQVDLVQVDVRGPTTTVVTNRVVFVAGGRITLATSTTESMRDDTSIDSTPLLRPAHALARTETHLLVTDSMGLSDYAFDGGTTSRADSQLANAELRYAPPLSTGAADEELAAFSGSSVGLCGRAALDLSCDPTAFQFATLPSSVKDVAFLDDDGFKRRSALAATSAGPFFAPREGGFLALDGGPASAPIWRKVALAGLSDGCAATPAPIDRLFYDDDRRTLTVTSDQDRRLTVFKHGVGAQPTGACAPLSFDPIYGPCAACGVGEQLLKLGDDGVSAGVGPRVSEGVVALCQRAVDAGTSVVAYWHHSPDGSCRLEPLEVSRGGRGGYQVNRETPGLGGVDGVGVPRACPQAGCFTMISGVAPDRVAGGPGLLSTHADDRVEAIGHVAQPSAISSTLGLRPVTYGRLYFAGSVTENPDWMLGSSDATGTVGDQSLVIQSMSRKLAGTMPDVVPLAELSRSSDLLPSISGNTLIDSSGTRAFSTLTADAEGQQWIIVGAGDRIWADPRALSEDAGIRTIGIKVVPLPSADIQALAFGAAERGDAGTGPLLEGYTVEQQRVFRVVVHSPSLWLSDEIRLGVTNTVPVSVWLDGSRGRVGTSDGRVFGLPVPVPLAPPIPEVPLPTVLEYGTLCGQAFALSPTALYRLSLQTPPLGTWNRVSLEAAHPGLDGFAPHWGATMHKARVGNEEHLYLFSESGLVIDLKATCP